MKILYYSPHPQLSLNAQTGPGTHMREIINAMQELGHEVLPVIMGDFAIINNKNYISSTLSKITFLKLTAKKIIPGIIWRSIKEYKLLKWDKWAQKKLEKEIEQFKPDLVYERAAYMQLSGINALKKSAIMHFMEINAPFIDEVQQFEKAPTFWLQKAKNSEQLQIQSPNRVYVVSTILKNYYLKYTSDEKKIKAVPNCVNINSVTINESLKNQLADKYKLKNKKVIGFVGSIFPYHGVDLLIRSFANISKLNKNIALLIVGDGSIIPDLKSLSQNLNLENVIFTGSISHNDIFTYISLMDITVMAKSNWYGSPVKIFEYGIMQKAIIAPNTSPVMDVMENGVDGLLINSTENELSIALGTLLSDETLRLELALTFHKKVIRYHTWQQTANRIIDDAKESLLTIKY